MAYLRYRELKPKKGIPFCRQHIGRLQKVGKFPLSVSLGPNTEVFIGEEIDQWTADRIAERDAKAAALAAQQQTAGRPRRSRNKSGGERKPQHQQPAQQRRSEQRAEGHAMSRLGNPTRGRGDNG